MPKPPDPTLRRPSRIARACLRWSALLAIALSAIACQADQGEAPAQTAPDTSQLLPVDEAFALRATALGPDRVELRWEIADGYYLYKHRMGATPADATVRSGALQLPKGKPHNDDFFGPTETYRDRVVASVPEIALAKTAAGEPNTLELKVRYQGCADIGVCYPPQTRSLKVSLPVAAATLAVAQTRAQAAPPAGNDSPSALPGLGRSGGLPVAPGGLPGLPGAAGKGPPLPEARAFGFEAIADGDKALLLRFTPAPGYYLYRDRSSFSLKADGITLGAPGWPNGTPYRDEHFGEVIVYFNSIDVPLPLLRSNPQAQDVVLTANFQGCQDQGICYPPMTRSVRIALPAVRGATADGAAGTAAATPAATAADAPAAAQATPANGDNTGTATGDAETVKAAAPGTPSTAADVTSAAANTNADNPTRAVGGTTAPATDATALAASPADAPAALRLFGLELNLGLALLGALLGGLILNLMPCVLPVLSIKVLGLLESGESRQRARAHALWYTAGVLVSFLALGGAVLALRDAGAALGWGFHLQRPAVVALLGLVMFAFGLSLSGVWTVGGRWQGMGDALTRRGGASGDFFTGVLAVVVAAPCTAPLMVQALGWALGQPAAVALLVFAFLGLGLALPFLLIAFLPGLARRLPRPGPWMETFKQLLAFPLYLTAVWLLGVLASQRGAEAVTLWAGAAVLVAFAAWAWSHGRSQNARWAQVAALLALAATLWPLLSIARLDRPTQASTSTATTASDTGAVPYAPQRLADLRAAGRVVFVNMTADWCVSCKANERTTLARDSFRSALREANAVYMVGDWTDVNPEITAYLQRYRAVGVPLYVVYPRGGGEGKVLPTLLAPGVVETALREAAQSGSAGAAR